jgi:hypothetical protein
VPEDGEPEQGLQQRAGQAENEKERGNVCDQQVLRHVRHHQLIPEVAERREERQHHGQQPAGKAELAPDRDRAPAIRKGRHPLRVQKRRDQRG